MGESYDNWCAYVAETYENLSSYTELDLLTRYLVIISYDSYGAPAWIPWHMATVYIAEIESVLGYTDGCMNDWDKVAARILDVQTRIDEYNECGCSEWANDVCVSSTDRKQIRTCDPPNCDLETRIVYDPSCTLPCECGPWENGDCETLDMRWQHRICEPSGCDIENQLVPDPACGDVPPDRTWLIGIVAAVGGLAAAYYLWSKK